MTGKYISLEVNIPQEDYMLVKEHALKLYDEGLVYDFKSFDEVKSFILNNKKTKNRRFGKMTGKVTQLALFQEVRPMSRAQFNALIRFECYYRIAVRWEDIRNAVNGYEEASKKIQAILAAKESGVIERRNKPANFTSSVVQPLKCLMHGKVVTLGARLGPLYYYLQGG